MKLKILLLLILTSGLLFFCPSFVRSESETTLSTEEVGEVQNIRQNVRKNILENKMVIEEKKEAFKEMIQAQKEKRKIKIEEIRSTLKEKRDNFTEKIKTIRDERKKQLTEKIDNRMSTVNKNQTNRMLKALEKLTEHVNKLEERVAKAKEKGINVLTVETLITTAKTAISDALIIVEEQAAKDYVFTITNEKNLGQSVKASYDALSQDLKKVQELLVNAKEAVVAAYKAVTELVKISPPPTVIAP